MAEPSDQPAINDGTTKKLKGWWENKEKEGEDLSEVPTRSEISVQPGEADTERNDEGKIHLFWSWVFTIKLQSESSNKKDWPVELKQKRHNGKRMSVGR